MPNDTGLRPEAQREAAKLGYQLGALTVDCPRCGAEAGHTCGHFSPRPLCPSRGRLARWLSREPIFTDTERYFLLHTGQ
jgi:endogenous inhibitor of DNA gyrase (YacG/DUF329 family)